ncbi:MAG: ribulose-phosphate 3-epimerase [Candidatus Eisenbacteria bacterium]|nr:ribulose-phosphate 3-epimerase [Candidatus Eisenbacteria bacterium]
MIRIAPSLLSCDFSRLKEEIEKVESGGADLLHIDVMDGHFVENMTFGPIIVEAIRKLTELELDVHLMIENPEKYIERFMRAGSDYLTIHEETADNALELLSSIKKLGGKPGLALNPDTKLDAIRQLYPSCDLVLLMTVYPGFGGQGFISDVLPKIEAVRKAKREGGFKFEIEVDGGINEHTAALASRAGAEILVAGNAIFKSPDPAASVRKIMAAGEKGLVAPRGDSQA